MFSLLRRPSRVLAVMLALLLVTLTACNSSSGGSSGKEDALGPRIEGTSSANGAPVLQNGDSWDELGAASTNEGTRVYAIDREKAKEGISVGIQMVITSIPDSDDSGPGFEAQLTTPSGDTCATDSGGGGFSLSPRVFANALVAVRGDADAACVAADRLVLSITKTGSSKSTNQLRLRLSRLPESNPDDYEVPPSDEEATAPQLGAPTKAEPGTWLTDAQRIEPKKTMSGNIGSGETQTFKISLDWGEGLSFQTSFPQPAPSERDKIKKAELVPVINIIGANGGTVRFTVYASSTAANTRGALAPLGYNSDDDLNTLKGDFTVVISALSKKKTDAKLAYQLVVDKTGSADSKFGPEIAETASSSNTGDNRVW